MFSEELGKPSLSSQPGTVESFPGAAIPCPNSTSCCRQSSASSAPSGAWRGRAGVGPPLPSHRHLAGQISIWIITIAQFHLRAIWLRRWSGAMCAWEETISLSMIAASSGSFKCSTLKCQSRRAVSAGKHPDPTGCSRYPDGQVQGPSNAFLCISSASCHRPFSLKPLATCCWKYLVQGCSASLPILCCASSQLLWISGQKQEGERTNPGTHGHGCGPRPSHTAMKFFAESSQARHRRPPWRGQGSGKLYPSATKSEQVLGLLLNINGHMESLFITVSCLELFMMKLATWCCRQVSRLSQVMFERATQPKFTSIRNSSDPREVPPVPTVPYYPYYPYIHITRVTISTLKQRESGRFLPPRSANTTCSVQNPIGPLGMTSSFFEN